MKSFDSGRLYELKLDVRVKNFARHVESLFLYNNIGSEEKCLAYNRPYGGLLILFPYIIQIISNKLFIELDSQ